MHKERQTDQRNGRDIRKQINTFCGPGMRQVGTQTGGKKGWTGQSTGNLY